jgi:hypothetical protein
LPFCDIDMSTIEEALGGLRLDLVQENHDSDDEGLHPGQEKDHASDGVNNDGDSVECYYDAKEFQVDDVKEGLCLLGGDGEQGLAQKVRVGRREVKIIGPIGCEHQGMNATYAKSEVAMEAACDETVLCITESNVPETEVVSLCDDCVASLKKAKVRRSRKDPTEEISGEDEVYCYALVKDLTAACVLLYSVDFGASKEEIAVLIYRQLWHAEKDVLYIGKVKFQVKTVGQVKMSATHDK